VNSFDPNECLELFNQYGLNSGTNIELFVKRIIKKKYNDENITFVDLAKKTGKNLVVCVSNLTKEVPEYFNVDTMSGKRNLTDNLNVKNIDQYKTILSD
jgi:hypothetical protein